ncbi:hypothetical protein GALMADRAFT_148242 [Galerina marginata CBS 339.88]|uniref:Uncharacterized protein n=1 Tax=Galerina marginata (strain CBS 339.88) TaxID=685588 RepID=A0A067S563_GALM3|nr:hypothetical protein GALMADRAFT_148242 [Galerina marginata CBS 339.88]
MSYMFLPYKAEPTLSVVACPVPPIPSSLPLSPRPLALSRESIPTSTSPAHHNRYSSSSRQVDAELQRKPRICTQRQPAGRHDLTHASKPCPPAAPLLACQDRSTASGNSSTAAPLLRPATTTTRNSSSSLSPPLLSYSSGPGNATSKLPVNILLNQATGLARGEYSSASIASAVNGGGLKGAASVTKSSTTAKPIKALKVVKTESTSVASKSAAANVTAAELA